MRIVKITKSGDVGRTVIDAGHVEIKHSLGDEYAIVVDVRGLDRRTGDPVTMRVVISKNEAKLIAAHI